MIVLIAGSPGVGKKSVASALGKELGVDVVRVNDLLFEKGLVSPCEEGFEISDFDRAYKEVNRRLRSCGRCIAVTHVVDLLEPALVDMAFVLRRNPLELLEEYRRRGYSKRKIAENILAEILDVVLVEALNRFGASKTCQVLCDDVGRVVEVIRESVEGGRRVWEPVDWIDYLSTLGKLDLLVELEKWLRH